MLDFFNEIRTPTPLIQLHCDLFAEKSVRVYLKADYLTHPLLSGNKWRKLKYNLLAAKVQNFTKLLSFGGAYSNHVYALAGVAKLTDFQVHIAVRGEELNSESNATLAYAQACGVKLHFVSRQKYRDKESIANEFGESFFVIPEGGSNEFSLRGTSEVIDEITAEIKPDYIIAAMGTGGTVGGFLTNETFQGKIIGIPVIKGGLDLKDAIFELTKNATENLTILPDYHLGGYGKTPDFLKQFMLDFESNFNIELDSIYTAKLCYAVMDLVRNDYFRADNKLVIYHSGGLRQ